MTQKIFVLTIGIGDYNELPKLTCPPNDARDFALVVHGGAMPSQIKFLIDADATKDAILQGLTWLENSAQSSDTAILFFSGHGARRSGSDAQSYLCPVDAASYDPEGTCLTSRDLTKALRAIKSDRLIVFLDTCHSGSIGDLYGENAPINLTQSDLGSLVEGNGRMILAASHPDELALESSRKRNAIFTSYLLEALKGRVAKSDGRVWASDVFSYVAHNLLRNHSQRAYQKAVGENFVIMVHDRSGDLTNVPLLTSSVSQRTLRIVMRSAYNHDELCRLCQDLGIDPEDLPGQTLETQLMHFIDFCHRHGLRERLFELLRSDHPHMFAAV